MKINKIGIIVLIVIIIACSLLVVYSPVEWLKELSSALLGGALLSLFICIVNHAVYLKSSYEKVTIKTHDFSIKAALAFNLYEESDNILDFFKTISQIYLDIYKIYALNYELIVGSFIFDPRRKQLKKIDHDLKNAIIKIFKIKCFVERHSKEAVTNLPKLYDDLKKISETRTIYRNYLSLAKWYLSSIHSPETKNRDLYMKQAAEDYKSEFENAQQKENDE